MHIVFVVMLLEYDVPRILAHFFSATNANSLVSFTLSTNSASRLVPGHTIGRDDVDDAIAKSSVRA